MANQPTKRDEDLTKNIGTEGRSGEREPSFGEVGNQETPNTAGERREETRGESGNVKSILTGKARDLVDQATSGRWDDVRQGAQEALTRAREVAGDVAGRARELSGNYVGNVGSTVRQYPFQALIVGFGVGALLGALIAGRRS